MLIDKDKLSGLGLEPGDIAAVKGAGPLPWLARRVFVPYTDRYHHALVWKASADDYILLESVSAVKGLAVGRLSTYDGQDVRFYRAVNLDAGTRARACDELTRYGRAPYDWLLCARLLVDVAVTEAAVVRSGRRPRKLRAEELPYREDGWLLCTEAVALAYRLVGWSLVPDGVMALPSAIRQAELDGLIREVTA